MNALLDDLQWRGLLHQSTDLVALSEALDKGLSFYAGFDPTAESLHVGSLLQLITARRLQAAGHRPVLLVGGATGLIGDPKPNAERKLADPAQVGEWVEAIRAQVEPFFRLEGENGAKLVNNADWMSEFSVLDFLRDVGKHFSINRMLARTVVASRLEASEGESQSDGEASGLRAEDGLSFTEFSYILLQSLDFAELFRREGVSLQFGGSDQWGNIVSGIALTRKTEGAEVHGFTTPLLTKADGAKFGKTEDGAIWLDPNLTSPFQFHQFWLKAEDAMMSVLLRFLSERPREEIQVLETATVEKPHLRLAQKALADELTLLVHGEEALANVKAAADGLFSGEGLEDLSLEALQIIAEEVGVVEVRLQEDMSLAALANRVGLVKSKGEAHRAAKEGSLRVNGSKAQDASIQAVALPLLETQLLILQRGKRNLRAVRVV